MIICLQTPLQQTDKLDLAKYPDYISAGGGFGPVGDLNFSRKFRFEVLLTD